MKATEQSAVGTSAYMVSKSGVESMLADYRANKFTDAVPNIMAKLFPSSRYAAYPMVIFVINYQSIQLVDKRITFKT